MDIIYRLCEAEVITPKRINHRPLWYSKESCLKSFLNSLEISKELINKVIFVHDGQVGPLLDLLPINSEIFKINKNSNEESIKTTFDIADDLTDDIYFVEDDYLHEPYSIAKIAITVPKLGLVTGYDHPDRYIRTDDIPYEKKIIFDQDSNQHWRTSESTCCTWAMSRDYWKQYNTIVRKHLLNDRELFRDLHFHKIHLWSAIPGIITQVDPYLSPGVDWENFNKQFIED